MIRLSEEPLDSDNDRSYVEALLRDVASRGWRVIFDKKGRIQFRRVRSTAEALPWELRWRIRHDHPSAMLNLVKPE